MHHDAGEDQADRRDEHRASAMQDVPERAFVLHRQRVETLAEAGEQSARTARVPRFVLRAFANVRGRDVLLRQKRDRAQREQQRNEHGDGEHDRQRVKELPFHASQEAEWKKHHDGGDRGRRHRPDQLPDGVANGRIPIRVRMVMADDVFGDHDGVVDHEADRYRHRAKRHQVQRKPREPHQKKRDQDGRRNDDRRNDRGAKVAEK